MTTTARPTKRAVGSASPPAAARLVGLLSSRIGEVAGTLAAQVLAAVGAVALIVSRDQGPLLVVGVAASLAALLVVAAVVVSQARRGQLDLDAAVPARILVAFAVGAGFDTQSDRVWAWVAVAVLVIATAAEWPVSYLLRAAQPYAVRLPGVPEVPQPPFAPGLVVLGSVGGLALGAVAAALGLPSVLFLAVALLLLGGVGVLAVIALRARRVTAATRPLVRKALQAYAPAFVVFYGAEAGTRYQLGMWLPYLTRLGRPYVVITCYPSTVDTIAELTDAPILVPHGSRIGGGIEPLVVPSMKAAFYVQGSTLNLGMQRMEALNHVWLNHGDSDKVANFTHKHQTYDTIMVAGQLGVDRYAAHGVRIPKEQFAVVGRPQLERIEVHDEPRPPSADGSWGPCTVLYAPTWKGGSEAVNYSSLPLGPRIVEELLARGCTVVFRPHPLSYNTPDESALIGEIHRLLRADAASSGRAHVYGRAAERDRDIPACINGTDALISDVSSVTSDYLASGKPFAVVSVRLGVAAFVRDVAIARVAYVVDKDLKRLPAALDDLLGPDPLAGQRRAYREYCLGTNLGADAPKEFLRVAGEIVDGLRPPVR